MRGSLWSLSIAAIFCGVFALSAISNAVPSNPAASTEATVGILNTLSPVVGLTLFLAAIGAAWVLAISRSTF